jgi:hypothetical protein
MELSDREREERAKEKQLEEERQAREKREREAADKKAQEQNGFTIQEPKRDVPEDERNQYLRTVDSDFTRYQREDGTAEYRWKKEGSVAFVDRGERIDCKSTDPRVVRAALEVAHEKGVGR